MSEVQYTLKAFRDDQIGAIHEKDVTPLDNHKAIANEIAERFGLGAFVKETISGKFIYEDGEILTYFRLTPLRN
jgi:hypothetical protein